MNLNKLKFKKRERAEGVESREDVYLKPQGQNSIWEVKGQGTRTHHHGFRTTQLFQQSNFAGEARGEVTTT